MRITLAIRVRGRPASRSITANARCTANAPNGAIRTCYAPAEPANRAENPLQTIPASARRSGNVGLQPRENPHTAGTFSRGTRGKCNLVSTRQLKFALEAAVCGSAGPRAILTHGLIAPRE